MFEVDECESSWDVLVVDIILLFSPQRWSWTFGFNLLRSFICLSFSLLISFCSFKLEVCKDEDENEDEDDDWLILFWFWFNLCSDLSFEIKDELVEVEGFEGAEDEEDEVDDNDLL